MVQHVPSEVTPVLVGSVPVFCVFQEILLSICCSLLKEVTGRGARAYHTCSGPSLSIWGLGPWSRAVVSFITVHFAFDKHLPQVVKITGVTFCLC